MKDSPAGSGRISTPTLICLIMGPLALIVSGGFLASSYIDYNNVANTPIDTIATLKDKIGSEKPLRLQVEAIGEPALQAPNGEQLAFEYIEIVHTSRTGKTSEDKVDFVDWAPKTFWVSDGKDKIEVMPEGITQDNLNVRGRESISDKGVVAGTLGQLIPAVIHENLKLNKWLGQRIKVCTIAKGDKLTILAAVGQKDSQPVLQKAAGRGLWVSTKSPEEVAEKSKMTMMISGAVLLIATLLSVFGVIGLCKKK